MKLEKEAARLGEEDDTWSASVALEASASGSLIVGGGVGAAHEDRVAEGSEKDDSDNGADDEDDNDNDDDDDDDVRVSLGGERVGEVGVAVVGGVIATERASSGAAFALTDQLSAVPSSSPPSATENPWLSL